MIHPLVGSRHWMRWVSKFLGSSVYLSSGQIFRSQEIHLAVGRKSYWFPLQRISSTETFDNLTEWRVYCGQRARERESVGRCVVKVFLKAVQTWIFPVHCRRTEIGNAVVMSFNFDNIALNLLDLGGNCTIGYIHWEAVWGKILECNIRYIRHSLLTHYFQKISTQIYFNTHLEQSVIFGLSW